MQRSVHQFACITAAQPCEPNLKQGIYYAQPMVEGKKMFDSLINTVSVNGRIPPTAGSLLWWQNAMMTAGCYSHWQRLHEKSDRLVVLKPNNGCIDFSTTSPPIDGSNLGQFLLKWVRFVPSMASLTHNFKLRVFEPGFKLSLFINSYI